MDNDIFTALSELRELKGAPLTRAVRKVSRRLREDEEGTMRFLRPLFTSYLAATPEYGKLSKSEFFERSVRIYTDDDGTDKIAVGVSYLQSFDDHDPLLDERVMASILELLSDFHVDKLVNDVTVNFIQARDGVVVSATPWEG